MDFFRECIEACMSEEIDWTALSLFVINISLFTIIYLLQKSAKLAATIPEVLFRLRGGGEQDLRAALEDKGRLSEANRQLQAEVVDLRRQLVTLDKQGSLLPPRVPVIVHDYQKDHHKRLRDNAYRAEKKVDQLTKALKAAEDKIAELEAEAEAETDAPAYADACVLAATAQKDARIRTLQAEMAVAASAASEANKALASALAAEKAESQQLRSSLEAQEAKSGDLASRLESESGVSQKLGAEVAELRGRERDAQSALREVEEAALAERAAADRVRGQMDAEISALKAQLAEAKAHAAVVVVDTAEMGVQTDLAVEASPVVTPVDVNDAGTQTECIGLDTQSQHAELEALKSELGKSKEALEAEGKKFAGLDVAYQKTKDSLVSCSEALKQRDQDLKQCSEALEAESKNEALEAESKKFAALNDAYNQTVATLSKCNDELKKVRQEAIELRFYNTQGGQELQQSKREVEHLKQQLNDCQQESANIMHQLKHFQETAGNQQPVAAEVRYWKDRTDALSIEMANLRRENLEANGKLGKVQDNFKKGQKQYHRLKEDLTQRLDAREEAYKALEKQLKAECEARDRDNQENPQVKSLEAQVTSRDMEILELRKELVESAFQAAKSTPKSGALGSDPFVATLPKPDIHKILANKEQMIKQLVITKGQYEKRLEVQDDAYKKLLESNTKLESKVASQVQELENLSKSKDELEKEKLRLEEENKKLEKDLSEEAMDHAFDTEFYEEGRKFCDIAEKKAKKLETQLDEVQASFQNMQLDLKLKENQVDAARMQADLYKEQAQNIQGQQEPSTQHANPQTPKPRPQKRTVSGMDEDGEPDQGQSTKKKILTPRNYHGTLLSNRLRQAQGAQGSQRPQPSAFSRLQTRLLSSPLQAQANQPTQSPILQQLQPQISSPIISRLQAQASQATQAPVFEPQQAQATPPSQASVYEFDPPRQVNPLFPRVPAQATQAAPSQNETGQQAEVTMDDSSIISEEE
ncbi:uncharacterized protein Z520_03131 [Fonsecaea multimorphosa CBS 102226]|uniref:Uncharacterized protein n=1 Tax=Fonsecaea multimorphosa CBS 102226 TaxID=1442371 RepID=A0A0D2KXM8_9EURO|nr:uncharacterized protein Z520_03131 [Fonsecaea multimorphosa CBS 102226]KIY01579.1 hypothetical protein Z520_03131 [Fonsecaea multimorphosa CBS 102226]